MHFPEGGKASKKVCRGCIRRQAGSFARRGDAFFKNFLKKSFEAPDGASMHQLRWSFGRSPMYLPTGEALFVKTMQFLKTPTESLKKLPLPGAPRKGDVSGREARSFNE
jgi:hypothetical protein